MISVVILVNGQPVMARSARRIEGEDGGFCKYRVDDGSIVRHHHAEGCVMLAKLLLGTIKE